MRLGSAVFEVLTLWRIAALEEELLEPPLCGPDWPGTGLGMRGGWVGAGCGVGVGGCHQQSGECILCILKINIAYYAY